MTSAQTLVIDASVAVKWYVPEEGSNAAIAVRNGSSRLEAPELIVAEFGNVLWKKVRRGELEAGEAAEIAGAFVSGCPLRIWPSDRLLPGALEIAPCVPCTVYDALYLATALAHDALLITADEHLLRAVQGSPLEDPVAPVEQRVREAALAFPADGPKC